MSDLRKAAESITSLSVGVYRPTEEEWAFVEAGIRAAADKAADFQKTTPNPWTGKPNTLFGLPIIIEDKI